MNIDRSMLSLIQQLSDVPGPSGFEDEVVELVKKNVPFIGRVEEDCLRNLYLYRKEHSGNKPVLMLDAHSDEVGFMIQAIRPDGTLRVLNIGGWSVSALPSTKVLVRTAEGNYIPGIIALKPVHFMTESERNNPVTDITSLVIDIGAASREEAEKEFHIRIGEPVVPATKFEYDEKHDLMFGKAFDCRIGCAALIETLRRLDGLDLDVDVVGVLSAQEEVGERGCKVAVNHVKPDIAVCFEGCPADDTFTESWLIQTALHHGPMIRHMDKSIICSPRFQRYTMALAEEKGLALQTSVRQGGGNNGAVVNTSLDGIPVIVAGVPVRYIHSVNCITSYYDFDATAALAAEIARSLSAEIIAKF